MRSRQAARGVERACDRAALACDRNPWPHVATSILVLRHGWGWDQAGLWSRHDFHVVARVAVGVSQHGPWCRDTEAARELRLGHDTLFGVVTWDRQLSVATRLLVSRHGLAFLVLRPEIGVAIG